MPVSATVRNVIDAAWARGLKPPPNMSVSEWAERNRVIGIPSPEPGPWRNARVPYLRGVMDCLSPTHPARIVAVQKGSQVGVTEASLNWAGYKIDLAPSSMLIVLPSERVAREWSAVRLTSLIENCPALSGKVIEARRRDSGNTTYLKRIAGGRGVIKIGWSSSAKVLRSTPAEDLILDEVDGFDGDTQGEGDPVALLERRFANFQRGKMLLISTPTERATSRIEREFIKGDQRYYFVACPACGHFQRFVFGQLRWPKGEPEKILYHCIACEEGIPEYRKTEMLAGGMWVATATAPDLAERGFSQAELSADLRPILAEMEEARRVSFHLSALYSPVGWYGWAQLGADWEAAQKDIGLLKVLIMLGFGETWIEKGEAPPWRALYDRREEYEIGTVPDGALFLTAGCDVQQDRLEVEIVAWGRDKISWSIDYRVLPGDTSTPEPWRQLTQLLARDWPCASGGAMCIVALAIDSGYRPQMAYVFAGNHPRPAYGPAGARVVASRTVICTKGVDDHWRVLSNVSQVDAASKRGGIRILSVGASCCKQELYDWLRLPAPLAEVEVVPPGFAHFPKYTEDYFRGLTSESRVIRSNGRPEWIKDPSVRNEPLDCRVLARAAAAVCGIDSFQESDWAGLERQSGQRIAPPPAAPATPAPLRDGGARPAQSFRPVIGRIRI